MTSIKKVVDRIKGPWSPEEDEALQNLVKIYDPRNWSLISKSIPGRSEATTSVVAVDPPTSLSLSLPESESELCDGYNHMAFEFGSNPIEMIRKEVRNYMTGIEQKGQCMQTEAIRNAVIKHIGISKIE
ncbi:hypothetical protein ACFX2I_017000 [Malus domestica]